MMILVKIQRYSKQLLNKLGCTYLVIKMLDNDSVIHFQEKILIEQRCNKKEKILTTMAFILSKYEMKIINALFALTIFYCSFKIFTH